MVKLKVFFKPTRKIDRDLAKLNFLFIFVFLNIWDFVVSRQIFNAMTLGLVMFTPAALLWFYGTFRAIALLTLISIFEFVVMVVFVIEGFELGGAANTLKSVFWLPYLLMAAINWGVGLRIYTAYKQLKSK
ncbi:MAG: hypothetical protein NUV69_00040 [Candidatus Curtissbacteria bacterium]|nr:hypothetical protein [Candidatus Curtissbacteria bacterium]